MLTYELAKMTDTEMRSVLDREGVDLARAMEVVSPVVREVRAGGDQALIRFAEKFDGFGGKTLNVPRKDIASATKRVPKALLSAMKSSMQRIERFHKRQSLPGFEIRDGCGVLGQKIVPLDRVGVYVPGGTADYVSTVFMACVPARIAGVGEVALCTPGHGGKVPDSILAAADMCGVTEVHPVGGAQSVAALAYGTETIKRVQKIVGPGGNYVTAAKLLVRNDCEIDFLAGPSEVLVIADSGADVEAIAADMLAQLEHDPSARALLVTDSSKTIGLAKEAFKRQLARAERRQVASMAAEKGAIFVLARSIEDATGFSNEYAPEHLLIDVRRPRAVLDKVRSAGSVFVGPYSSVAFGDYCSGTNHILPTRGAAAMKSALAVYDFLKVIPYQEISGKGAAQLAEIVDEIARAEGLPAHAYAANLRARRSGK
jgi:histidinol dehydrogenase